MKGTNPNTHPNSPSPPQWRLGTNTTSLRLLGGGELEKCRTCHTVPEHTRSRMNRRKLAAACQHAVKYQ